MSLAATTSTTLSLIGGDSLKLDAHAHDVQRTPLLVTPKTHAWSPDNSTLYILSSGTIQTFLPSSSTFVKLYRSPQGSSLQPVLVSRDKTTLIFAQGSTIHLLAVGSNSPKIASSLTGHPAPVISLSLSNDASLLASASTSGTVHVHNLAHNSQTVLRALPGNPSASSKNVVCAFHPHARTRLLVGSGKTLIIYDTTRPSGPVKSIILAEKESTGVSPNIGHVMAISCSPISKTLVAVACNSGFVGLIDLEKDKPLFKTLHMKVPVTSMSFTADGNSIAMGTVNGKVLVQDLRSADKDHHTILVGEEGKGEYVIALSVQKRMKNSPYISSVATARSTTATARLPTSVSAPLSQHDLNDVTAGVKSPARRVVSSSPSTKGRGISVTPVRGRAKKEGPPKCAFSPPSVPVRGDDIADISVQIETLMCGGTQVEGKQEVPKAAEKEQLNVNATKPRLSVSRTTPSSVSSPASGRARTRAASGITVLDRPSSRLTVDSRPGSRKTSVARSEPPAGPRTRTISRSSDAPTSFPTQTDSATTNWVRDAVSSIIPPSSTAPILLASTDQTRRASGASTIGTAQTHTPDLPSLDDEESLVWKNNVQGLEAATSAAGVLSTPDMERWIEAGQGKPHAASKGVAQAGAKRVGWADSDGDDSARESDKEELAASEGEEPTVSAAMDKGKTPAHIAPTPSAPSNLEMSPMRRPHLPSGALQLSPLRSSPLRGNAGVSGGHGNGGAQELLRAVVKDVMYEYRQETREDIKGLHLDLLRMGRSWKTELRSLMDEYVGDLRELREENASLRKENERLRRGF